MPLLGVLVRLAHRPQLRPQSVVAAAKLVNRRLVLRRLSRRRRRRLLHRRKIVGEKINTKIVFKCVKCGKQIKTFETIL